MVTVELILKILEAGPVSQSTLDQVGCYGFDINEMSLKEVVSLRDYRNLGASKIQSVMLHVLQRDSLDLIQTNIKNK